MTITISDNSAGSISLVAGATIGSSSTSTSQWVISRSTGNNKLVGGTGDDIIHSSGTSNLMTGGLGNDVFEFFYNPTNAHVITDFSSGDIIVLTDIGYSGGSTTINALPSLASLGGTTNGLVAGGVAYQPFGGGSFIIPSNLSNEALGIGGRTSAVASILHVNDTVSAGNVPYLIVLEGTDIGSNLRYTNQGGYIDPYGRIQDTFLYLYSGSSAISGSAIGGNQLTAVITDNTFLSNAPSSGIIYRWYADGNLVSTSSVDDRFFTISLSLLGKQITVSASYIDGYGNLETSALSSASSAVNGILAFASTVSENLDYVQANYVALSGGGVTFNIFDGANTAVNATIAQLTSHDDALDLIRANGNLIGVADTASAISAGISTLVANAGILSDLSITDSGLVSINSSQASSLLGLAASFSVDLSSHAFDGDILVNRAANGTLYIKVGGNLTTASDGELIFFNGVFSGLDGIYANASSIVPLFASSGGIGGYTLPDLFTGPSSLGLTYQLIETAQNAVVTGSSSSEFIKVADSNSIGKAVNGNGGNDVIDGGEGSTFVTGGANHNTTFFLDGRAPGVSWSTITDFQAGVDKATIWGFVRGVSSIDTSFTNYNNEGATGYQGLTLHFKNLLPDGQTTGSNPNLNSITLTGHTLESFGASSLADLNNQINNGTNAHFIVGATQDSLGTHSYLYIH